MSFQFLYDTVHYFLFHKEWFFVLYSIHSVCATRCCVGLCMSLQTCCLSYTTLFHTSIRSNKAVLFWPVLGVYGYGGLFWAGSGSVFAHVGHVWLRYIKWVKGNMMCHCPQSSSGPGRDIGSTAVKAAS